MKKRSATKRTNAMIHRALTEAMGGLIFGAAIAAVAAAVLVGCEPREGIHRPDEEAMIEETVTVYQVEDRSGSHLFRYVELPNGCIVTFTHRESNGIYCRQKGGTR